MKKLFLTCLVILFVFACAGVQPSTVCPPPEGQESWICDKSAEAGVTPEQVYGWIFSATAIAAIGDVADIEEICDFKKEIDDWYVDVYPVSYDSVINKVVEEMKLIKDPRKFLLMKNILNQNLTLYASPGIIGPYDDGLLRAGSVKFDRDMMCK